MANEFNEQQRAVMRHVVEPLTASLNDPSPTKALLRDRFQALNKDLPPVEFWATVVTVAQIAGLLAKLLAEATGQSVDDVLRDMGADLA